MINNQNQTSPLQDALYQLARTALRQGNAAFLPHALKKLQKKIESKTTSDYMEAELLILAAEIARALDHHALSVEQINRVINHPPAGSGFDILSRAQRLRASLYLDDGAVEQAAALGNEIDAVVIVNSESRGGEQFFSRNPNDVAVETFLLQSEIALFSSDTVEAANFLMAGATRLADTERDNRLKKLSAFEARQNAIFCAELRYKLHLWEATLRIATGDEEGFSLLRLLAEQVAGDAQADRRIPARIRALLGEFEIESGAPVGIGRSEAMRLFALGTHKVVRAAKEIVFDEENFLEISDSPNLFDLQPVKPSAAPNTEMALAIPVQTGSQLSPQVSDAIEKIADSQVATNMQMSAMFEQLNRVLEKLPVQSATLATNEQKRRPFAFGGGFAFFDLVTQLGNAEQVHFTGFFQCQWSPDMIETSVLAGNLDPLARTGEGFIFMKEGTIIDATIGSYDAPEEFAAGVSPAAEADAKRSLTVMIQVGIGLKLDCTPDGFGEGYPSAAVKERAERLRYRQFPHLATLITEREEELQ